MFVYIRFSVFSFGWLYSIVFTSVDDRSVMRPSCSTRENFSACWPTPTAFLWLPPGGHRGRLSTDSEYWNFVLTVQLGHVMSHVYTLFTRNDRLIVKITSYFPPSPTWQNQRSKKCPGWTDLVRPSAACIKRLIL